jgi:ribosome modulation factor
MTTDAPDMNDPHWSLESLNKAYQQGYMAGLTAQRQSTPYPADVLQAAWEAGHDDGHEQFLLQRKQKIA